MTSFPWPCIYQTHKEMQGQVCIINVFKLLVLDILCIWCGELKMYLAFPFSANTSVNTFFSVHFLSWKGKILSVEKYPGTLFVLTEKVSERKLDQLQLCLWQSSWSLINILQKNNFLKIENISAYGLIFLAEVENFRTR